MTEEKARPGCANRAGSLHILLLSHGQDHPPYQPGHTQPGGDPDPNEYEEHPSHRSINCRHNPAEGSRLDDGEGRLEVDHKEDDQD